MPIYLNPENPAGEQSWLKPRNSSLSNKIDKMALLLGTGVDFVPASENSTMRTSPFLEDSSVNWREMYKKAALIYLTNPICFGAQRIMNSVVSGTEFILQEQIGTEWAQDTTSPMAAWLRRPNQSMNTRNFLKAWTTHRKIFGGVKALMFQKGEILQNGLRNTRDNNFDIIFPTRMTPDYSKHPDRVAWLYQPGEPRIMQPTEVNPESFYIDVEYNPIAHSLGVALPTNPLNDIFELDALYRRQLKSFYYQGGHATHVFTRKWDVSKEGYDDVKDEDIERALQKAYAQIGFGGKRENGWVGLKGDWELKKLGSTLAELMNAELSDYLQAAVSSVWGVPASMFAVGLKNSNQRASRQQDALDFFNYEIDPLLEEIEDSLGEFLIPLFFPGETQGVGHRLAFDLDSMFLAQYQRRAQVRMIERLWQLRVFKLGRTLDEMGFSKVGFTTQELEEFYVGGQAGAGLSAASGDTANSVENANGND